MVPQEPYEAYVLGRANDANVCSMSTLTPYVLLMPTQISTCVGFQAIAQANNRFSKGLWYTGVGGVFRGRFEMIVLDMLIWTTSLPLPSETPCYSLFLSATTSPASGSSTSSCICWNSGLLNSVSRR